VKPSVGRIAHYVSYGTPGGEYISECRAAIITEVVPIARVPGADIGVSLCVLNPAGQFFNRNVAYDEGPAEGIGTNLCGGRLYRGGTWHWPEREPSEDSVQVKVNTDLSPQQIKSLTAAVQAELIKQAKRGQRGPGAGV
jgi:hypothetical protein